MKWKFASWMKENHSSSFSFISNNIISLLSSRKKASTHQKASFVCFLRKQGYHVTNFARKTKVSNYKCWRWKNKIITFASFKEFKMNEIQRKSLQQPWPSWQTVIVSIFGPWTNKLHASSRWLKTYWQSCITLCTIWDCLTSSDFCDIGVTK